MQRGKCQACGIYANLETVRLQTGGRTIVEAQTCRRCACEFEDNAVRLWQELARARV